jgi:CRISPR-associated endonuclease Csn1
MTRILGLDVGIASCGWAILETTGDSGGIVAAGVRCFDPPLVAKTGEPKSAERRTARGQRRVIHRRRLRMNRVRELLARHGALPDADRNALAGAARRLAEAAGESGASPWRLRAAAHDRALCNDEFAVVLGHIARHRGFRSNSKREAGANAPDETSKMKKAMEQTREGLAKYRAFGEMIADDPKFAQRKRNRDKDYSHTPKRSDLEIETGKIFAAQRRFQQQIASDALERDFAEAAFSQRPLQDSETMLGYCPFEPSEKRTAKHAPSFELFRFLSRLVTLKLTSGRTERSLSADEIARASRDFGQATKGVTFTALRRMLDLDPGARFVGIPVDREKYDVAARKGEAAAGTHALHQALGDAPWASLARTPEKLDRVAEVLSFREDFARIADGLREIGLDPLVCERLLDAARNGAFSHFGGAAHISAKAARAIIPGLREGLDYSEACARVGYDHAVRPTVALKDINSPVARRAFLESIKQVRAILRAFGPIDEVNVELARDVGKSTEERAELTQGIEDRNKEKDKRAKEASEILGATVSADELLRYELSKEQNFKCVYCDAEIAPNGFSANDARYQVDHILPWSRFGDDSYFNKTLCCAACNQHKRGRTPSEWFDDDKTAGEWDAFAARVEGYKEMKGRKKRNFKLRDVNKDVEDKFKARNLTDTQWATRLLAIELERMFPPKAKERRVYTRPGAITSKLRRAWGLEGQKKVDGERVADDRHHAIDAIVLAATTASLLQWMTKQVQQREREGRGDDIFHVAPPWRGFREDSIRAIYGEGGVGGIFVSRAERPRARGKAHDATIRQIREIDGEEVVFERKAIEKLTPADLDRIPVPAPYGAIVDPAKLRDATVAALRAWIDAGKPKGEDKLPRSPKGDIIRKVRVETDVKVAIRLQGGTVDRTAIVRLDVFETREPKSKSHYRFVPIYAHEIVESSAPNQFFELRKPAQKWKPISNFDKFMFSLAPMCLTEIATKGGEPTIWYYRGFDSNDGRITLSPHQSKELDLQKRIAPTTIESLKKLAIDRLGCVSEVPRETRTWRGAVCT